MLRITKLTDYAIVLLAHQARTPSALVSARELSEATGVPFPTVQKVLKQLVQGDVLRSERGAQGGYGFAREPSALSVADVVEVMEGPLALTACAGSDAPCTEHPHCAVSEHWPVINRAVQQALAAVTILELSRPRASCVTARALSPHASPHNASTARPLRQPRPTSME